MQKKEIEKIPPLTAEKAEARYKAVAACKKITLKKAAYLIIDIFKNKKACLSEYTVRIVINGKEFANLFPDGKWTEQKIYKKDYRYVWETDRARIQPEEIYMSPQNEALINKTLHSFSRGVSTKKYIYRWEKNISLYEDILTEKRWETAQMAKEKACRERNAGIKPAPDEFIKWAKSLHGAGVIYYQRKGTKAEFTCSKCGRTYERKCVRGESLEAQAENIVEIPKRGNYAVCSLCGAQGIYQNKGRCIKGVYSQTKTAYFIQPHIGDAAVIRQYNIERIIQVGSPEQFIIREYGRLFIGNRIHQKDWYMQHYNITEGESMVDWTYKNLWGYYSVKDEEGYLWRGSTIDGTFLKYSQIFQYSLRVKTFKPTYFAEAYKKYPELEIIIKLGMDSLADTIVKSYQWLKIVSGSSVHERLGIRKADMKALIKEKGEWSYLEVLQLENEKNIFLSENERKKLQPYISALKNNRLNTALSYMSIRKFISTIEKYSGCQMDTSRRWAKEKIRHTITEYLYYLNMRQTIHNDLSNTVFLYPRSLREAHAVMVREASEKRTEEYIKQREEMYSAIRGHFREYMKKYYRESGRLFVRPAMSAEEIILEGRIQHHCVGGDGYLKKHSERKSVILFLRYKEAPETPYVTIEITGNEIIQWYSAHDRKADKEQNDKWLAEYVRRLNTAAGQPLSRSWQQATEKIINSEHAQDTIKDSKETLLHANMPIGA